MKVVHKRFSDAHVILLRKTYIRASAIGVYIWALYFLLWVIQVSSVTVIGADFRPFITAGTLVHDGFGRQLYSLPLQFHRQQMLFPQLHDIRWLLPFLNPPFVSLFFVPFVVMPIQKAFIVWEITQLLLLTLVQIMTLKILEKSRIFIRAIAAAMILTFMPIIEVFREGQLSLLLVLSLLFAWLAFRKGNFFRAGLWLSLLACKPHFLVLPVLLLLWKKPKAFLGVAIGCAFFFVISVFLVQIDGIRDYVVLLKSASGWNEMYGIHPQLEQSWNGMLHVIFQKNMVAFLASWVIGDLIAVMFLFWSWRRVKFDSDLFGLQWALLVFVMIFLGPHVGYHDLSMLIVSGLAVGSFLSGKRMVSRGEKLLAMLPFLGYGMIGIDFIFLWVHVCVHLSTIFTIIAMTILVFTIWSQRIKNYES